MTDDIIRTAVRDIMDNAGALTVHGDAAGLGAFMALAGGYQVHSLEEFQPAPSRIVAARKFRDVASLADYLGRFEVAESVALSRPTAGEIHVIIDHHAGPGRPAWCSHSATFAACFTPEYAAWQAIDRKPMAQVQALEFLEERAVDVIEPTPADIMDIIMNFDALKRVSFKQSTRLHDGQRQFVYHEENEARGQVILPEMIRLRLPIYEGMEPDTVCVRVRYRIEDGRLSFAFLIDQRPAIELTAFERCEDALKVARGGLMILRSC